MSHNNNEALGEPKINERSKHAISALQPHQINHICCIGAGYVGGPTSAVIAYKAPKVNCTVVDIDKSRIAAWNSSHLPILEPQLEEIVKIARDGIPGERDPNLFFNAELDPSIAMADAILISVNTPTKSTGLGAGSASDLSAVESAARLIARNVSTGYKIIIEKSTVPCRTAEAIRDIIEANADPGFTFDVLSNPEFLAEGTAVNNLLFPDRVLIGSLPGQDSSMMAAESLAKVYSHWIPQDKILFMSLWSSELAKLAANAMLAQRISSINTLSAICEATQASISEVAHAVGLDRRIGGQMLQASVGFGGSCFKKDVLNLVYLSECLNLPQVAAYWRSIIEINEWQKSRFSQRIIQQLYGSLSQKRISVLGFTYKKNTKDTRESPSISVVRDLVAEGGLVAIYDPQAGEGQVLEALRQNCNCTMSTIKQHVVVCESAYAACREAHAVVIITDWDEFRNPINGVSTNCAVQHPSIDWKVVARLMRRPMSVFDGRNILHVDALERLGFKVYAVGNSS